MVKICKLVIGATLLSLIVGCDSNPSGPTFPTIPEGTKLPPANDPPMQVAPPAAKDKSGTKIIDSTQAG